VFTYEQSPNTYRIFCLGGSTTAGFPYGLNISFPDFLYDRLNTLFPDRNIEVINLGLSAVNSYTVLDFVHELIEYQPDLLIIYMGHNEFYGAFGVGSTESLGRNRNIVKLYLSLRKLKLFMALRDGLVSLKTLLGRAHAVTPRDRTLMEVMVKEKYIPLDSQDYRVARRNFRANLEEIIDVAQKHHVGLIVSTLVSNLKDFEPFHSMFRKGISEGTQREWQQTFEECWRQERAGNLTAALEWYKRALIIDRSPAIVHYRLGKCWEALGSYPIARQAYERALDLDALRFRAPGEFNRIIVEVCQNKGVPVVDMEAAFAQQSKHGIIGSELITEHLHPNVEGYFLMGKVFCEALADHGFLAAKSAWRWDLNKSDEQFRRLSGVTPLDVEIGNLRIERLTEHWPFKQKVALRAANDPVDEARIREIAQDWYDRNLPWNDAHYQMARYYIEKRAYEEADAEYHAVMKVMPWNYYPYFKLGDLYALQKKYNEAKKMYTTALQLNQASPFVHVKLGMLYLTEGAHAKAADHLRQALALNDRRNQFKPEESLQARYLLSVAYAQSGNADAARAEAEKILVVRPDFGPARELLKQLGAGKPPHS